MIVDEVKLTVQAGHGGKGMVTFSKVKFMLGPTGGNGGTGGDIYFEGVADLGALRQFRYRKVCEANKGEHGRNQLNDGANGDDLILFVPVGTVAHIAENRKNIEITKIGQFNYFNT